VSKRVLQQIAVRPELVEGLPFLAALTRRTGLRQAQPERW